MDYSIFTIYIVFSSALSMYEKMIFGNIFFPFPSFFQEANIEYLYSFPGWVSNSRSRPIVTEWYKLGRTHKIF